MNTVDMSDGALAGRLKRLDASASELTPGFDYQGMVQRHAAGKARARRRQAVMRGTASALAVLMISVSVWRFDAGESGAPTPAPAIAELPREAPQPRLVRADTYLALAALEDHIASIDDALNDARLVEPRGEDVVRLERTRAELVDSYAQVRYAEMVAANY